MADRRKEAGGRADDHGHGEGLIIGVESRGRVQGDGYDQDDRRSVGHRLGDHRRQQVDPGQGGSRAIRPEDPQDEDPPGSGPSPSLPWPSPRGACPATRKTVRQSTLSYASSMVSAPERIMIIAAMTIPRAIFMPVENDQNRSPGAAPQRQSALYCDRYCVDVHRLQNQEIIALPAALQCGACGPCRSRASPNFRGTSRSLRVITSPAREIARALKPKRSRKRASFRLRPTMCEFGARVASISWTSPGSRLSISEPGNPLQCSDPRDLLASIRSEAELSRISKSSAIISVSRCSGGWSPFSRWIASTVKSYSCSQA